MTYENKISNEWHEWINANLKIGVDKDYIFNTLLEHGFSYNLVKKEMKHEPKIKQHLPEKWKRWLKENIRCNNDKDGLFKILLMHGFSFDCIQHEMQYQPSVPLDRLPTPLSNEVKPQQYSVRLKTLNPKNATKIETNKLEIFYIDNFLSKFECDHLLSLIKKKSRPSELTQPEKDPMFRTSKTCHLDKFGDKIVKEIDTKICQLVGVESNLSEPIQGQLYKIGEEFKPHTDFFEQTELKAHGNEMGQRTYTVMIYLNSTLEGGETIFPLIDTEFLPKQGKAVIWSNLNHDYRPNHFSLHHAKQVRQGFKAIITKWFRTGISTI